jgi:hypothetical protein
MIAVRHEKDVWQRHNQCLVSIPAPINAFDSFAACKRVLDAALQKVVPLLASSEQLGCASNGSAQLAKCKPNEAAAVSANGAEACSRDADYVHYSDRRNQNCLLRVLRGSLMGHGCTLTWAAPPHETGCASSMQAVQLVLQRGSSAVACIELRRLHCTDNASAMPPRDCCAASSSQCLTFAAFVRVPIELAAQCAARPPQSFVKGKDLSNSSDQQQPPSVTFELTSGAGGKIRRSNVAEACWPWLQLVVGAAPPEAWDSDTSSEEGDGLWRRPAA